MSISGNYENGTRGRIDSPYVVNLEPNYEFSICERKLGDSAHSIQNFDLGNRENEYRRTHSRLFHLELRLERIRCDAPQALRRNALARWCQQLLKNGGRGVEGALTEEVPLRIPTTYNESLPLIPNIIHTGPTLIDVPDGSENGEHNRSQNGLYSFRNDARNSTDVRNENNFEVPPAHEQPDMVRRETIGNVFCSSVAAIRNQQSRVAELREIFESNVISPSRINTTRVVPPNFSHRPDTSVRFNNRTEGVSDNSWRGWDNPTRAYSTIDFSTQLRHLQLSSGRNESTRHDTERSCPEGTLIDMNSSRWGRSFLEVSGWNLQYDDVSSVTGFLERVKELRVSRGCSKARLLQSAAELFKNDALLWYRMNHFISWDDLVEELRDAFQPHDYEQSLWDEIRRRTQGSQEQVINHVSVLENLFKRLSVVPREETRVQIIRRDFSPHLQAQLSIHDINSLSTLINLARSVEETEWRIQKFCPPPSNLRGLLEPDLAYRRPSNVSVISKNNSMNFMGIDQPYFSDRPVTLCWNCRKSGHRFRQCDQPNKLFCFRCGQENVTKKTCPQCQKNLTATRKM
ncbi:hypothetical protein JTB14_004110 [Gonioctena quinquepunctata]|nr:hypothetical protein JTB14_004110 [Gonioctena quinquepunctata]